MKKRIAPALSFILPLLLIPGVAVAESGSIEGSLRLPDGKPAAGVRVGVEALPGPGRGGGARRGEHDLQRRPGALRRRDRGRDRPARRRDRPGEGRTARERPGGTPEEVVAKIKAFGEAGARRIYLQTLDLSDLDHLRSLEEGSLDVVFSLLPLPPGPYEARAVLRDPWVLVVQSGSELVERPPDWFDLERVGRLPLVCFRAPRSIDDALDVLAVEDAEVLGHEQLDQIRIEHVPRLPA